jgi:hypothetical protein
MKRNVWLIVLAIVMIMMGTYRLWWLDQPRVGPIGEGHYHPAVYISIYSGMIAGVCFLVLGIIRLIKHKRK